MIGRHCNIPVRSGDLLVGPLVKHREDVVGVARIGGLVIALDIVAVVIGTVVWGWPALLVGLPLLFATVIVTVVLALTTVQRRMMQDLAAERMRGGPWRASAHPGSGSSSDDASTAAGATWAAAGWADASSDGAPHTWTTTDCGPSGDTGWSSSCDTSWSSSSDSSSSSSSDSSSSSSSSSSDSSSSSW